MTLIVLKLGGANALGAADTVAELARTHDVCVVHGGGPQITARMQVLGLEPRFIGGRRFTDAATLACVRGGLHDLSTKLAAALDHRGIKTAPLPDGAVIAAPVAELGLVGTPTGVDRAVLEAALADGCVPIVSPLARTAAGKLLNVNADDAAAAIAVALRADELRFLSNVPGVLDAAGKLLASVKASAPPAAATGGMVPKLDACSKALRGGVALVRIGDPGTLVVR